MAVYLSTNFNTCIHLIILCENIFLYEISSKTTEKPKWNRKMPDTAVKWHILHISNILGGSSDLFKHF